MPKRRVRANRTRIDPIWDIQMRYGTPSRAWNSAPLA